MKTAHQRAESAAIAVGDDCDYGNAPFSLTRSTEIILLETGLEGLVEAGESLFEIRQRILELSAALYARALTGSSYELDQIVKLIDSSLSKLTPPEA